MRNTVSIAAAAGAILLASPAFAQVGVGVPGAGANVGVGAQVSPPPVTVPPVAVPPIATPQPQASTSADASASASLSGLSVGTTIRNATGGTVGTVRQVQRAADGAVTGVVIRATDGTRRVLTPGSISLNGEAWVTTDAGAPQIPR